MATINSLQNAITRLESKIDFTNLVTIEGVGVAVKIFVGDELKVFNPAGTVTNKIGKSIPLEKWDSFSNIEKRNFALEGQNKSLEEKSCI